MRFNNILMIDKCYHQQMLKPESHLIKCLHTKGSNYWNNNLWQTQFMNHYVGTKTQAYKELLIIQRCSYYIK